MNYQEIKKLLNDFTGLTHEYYDRFLLDDSISNLDGVLLSIYLIDKKNKKSCAKYDEVKNLFISFGRKYDNFRVAVHNAKKQNLIVDEDKYLCLLITGLKKIRKLLGQIEKSPVHVIKSGQNFTAIKLLEEFLLTEINENEVLLCDPYISHLTLYPFAVLNGKIKSLKILTSNIYDPEKLKDYKKKMEKEMNIIVEIKVNKKIHDRYLIYDKKCWHFGASIKDLGNKDTTMKEISEVVDSMKQLFKDRWEKAE